MAKPKLTAEEELKIHTALEMTSGDVALASEILEVDNKWLHNIIAANKNLALKWKGGKEEVSAPTEAITISRPVIQEPPADVVLLGDREIAKSLSDEDAAVRKGLEAMGVKGEMLNLSTAFRDFSRKHFSSAFEVVSGGVTRQYMDVVAEIIRITNLLNTPKDEDEKPDINDAAREMMLREDRAKLLDFSVKLYDRTLKAVLIASKIRAMKQGKEKGDEAPKGFLSLKKVK